MSTHFEASRHLLQVFVLLTKVKIQKKRPLKTIDGDLILSSISEKVSKNSNNNPTTCQTFDIFLTLVKRIPCDQSYHNVERIPFYCVSRYFKCTITPIFYLTQSSYHLDLNVNIFEVNGENQNGDQEFKMANPECLK